MKRLSLALFLLLTSCAGGSHVSFSRKEQVSRKRIALVSYYSCCNRTANGEKFNRYGFTAANRTLPFGLWVLFSNPANNRSVKARINDRGPFVKERLFDVSEGAAIALGFRDQGTARLEWEIVK